MNPSKPGEIVIGIPTYRRPEQLCRLLDSISHLEQPAGSTVSIVIADNDMLHQEGLKICEKLSRTGYRFEIITISVAERGISHSRNQLLEQAFVNSNADYLVMVDDDEEVSPQWITKLLELQDQTQAAAVGGHKLPKFARQPEPWMSTNDVYYYRPANSTGPCHRLVSTDNLMLSRKAFRELGNPMFDERFALTGGGDTEFLHRIKKCGGILAFSMEAETYEIVPEQRMSKQWARTRALRIGIGLMRIYRLHEPGLLKTLGHFAKLGSIMLVSAVMVVILLPCAKYRMKYEIAFLKQLGKIQGFFGRRVFPYE